MLRFRIFWVALVGDLEKAFLNVSVHPDDRNVLRVLWVSDVHSDSTDIVVKRFTRLVFGVSPSPFLLSGTLEHHVKKYQDVDPEFVQRFLSGLYVDDLSSGDESVDKSLQLYLKSKSGMLEAGFNMRKWSSNSPELMEMVKECEQKDQTQVQLTPVIIQEDATYASNTLGPKHEINEDEEHKVLGITWNHKTDELIMCFVKIVEMTETLPLTKRTMLKIIASVCYLLGWISPIVIPMKVLFQALCRCKQECDAEDKETLYLGDTNCDMLDSTNDDTKRLMKLLTKFNLVQLIKTSPTRTMATTKTITLKEREWALVDDMVEELYEYKNLGVLKNYCGSFASNISDRFDIFIKQALSSASKQVPSLREPF